MNKRLLNFLIILTSLAKPVKATSWNDFLEDLSDMISIQIKKSQFSPFQYYFFFFFVPFILAFTITFNVIKRAKIFERKANLILSLGFASILVFYGNSTGLFLGMFQKGAILVTGAFILMLLIVVVAWGYGVTRRQPGG